MLEFFNIGYFYYGLLSNNILLFVLFFLIIIIMIMLIPLLLDIFKLLIIWIYLGEAKLLYVFFTVFMSIALYKMYIYIKNKLVHNSNKNKINNALVFSKTKNMIHQKIDPELKKKIKEMDLFSKNEFRQDKIKLARVIHQNFNINVNDLKVLKNKGKIYIVTNENIYKHFLCILAKDKYSIKKIREEKSLQILEKITFIRKKTIFNNLINFNKNKKFWKYIFKIENLGLYCIEKNVSQV